MEDFFDQVPLTDPLVTNGKKQYRAKPAELVSYKQNAPNTLAEVAAGVGKAVHFGSTEFLTTNRTVEAGAKGVRNPDGSLGFYQANYPIVKDGATITPTFHGGFVSIGFGQSTASVTLEGGYPGQVINIEADATDETVITATNLSFVGVHRTASGAIDTTGVATPTVVYLRQFETMQLVYVGSRWRILSFNYHLKSGNGWRENEDGTVDMWGLNTWALSSHDVTLGDLMLLPVALSNTNYNIVFQSQWNTDASKNTSASIAQSLIRVGLETGTSFTIFKPNDWSYSQSGSGACHVYWQLKGGILA